MKISVVIPVYNSAVFLRACLDALMPQLPLGTEVWVVDNGSTDGSAAQAKAAYPAVRVIRNEENLGAARARNQGIEASTGEWVLALDCDVAAGDRFVDAMVLAIEKASPRAGMIQTKILRSNGAIFSTGIQLTFLRRFIDRGMGRMDTGQFDVQTDIFGVCCAAAAYRRLMLEQVKDRFGYFDERFFFLAEDVDVAWRARRAGWTAAFCPQAVCRHDGDSSRTPRPLRQYYCFRNRRWMLEKNETLLGRFRNILLSPFYEVPRRIVLAWANPYFRRSLWSRDGFRR